MATINTASAGYLDLKAKLVEVRDAVRPHLKRYFKMTEAEQDAWRAADPLLRSVLDWAEKIADRSE